MALLTRSMTLVGLCLWATICDDLLALQLSSGWKLLSNDSQASGPGPRAGSVTWSDRQGRAWMFGGRGPHPTVPNATVLWSDLWTLNVTEATWRRQVAPSDGECVNQIGCGPDGRELASMCGSSDLGTLVVFGGRTLNGSVAGEMLTLTILDGQQRHWRTRKGASLSPLSRYDALSWCDEDAAEMWVVGGYDADGRLLSDAWRLSLANLTWTRAPLPDTDCAWTAAGEDHNVTDVAPPLMLVWLSNDGTLHVMCDARTNGSNVGGDDDDDVNIQLWKRETARWRLVAESRCGATTWPGTHRHGSTCSDSGGDLWLFGGRSEIGDHHYLNNDVWRYGVDAAVWSKAELPATDGAQEPEQRHLSASWCVRDSMVVYGGNDDGGIRGDLWALDLGPSPTSATMAAPPTGSARQNRITVTAKKPRTSTSGGASAPSSTALPLLRFLSNAIPTEGATVFGPGTPSSSSSSPLPTVGASKGPYGTGSVPIVGKVIDQPTRQEVQDIPDLQGAHGSVIFFGISLSMFALSGLVIFFRRCVSCPPRENVLLKEPPPVRYTVIPDESYTI